MGSHGRGAHGATSAPSVEVWQHRVLQPLVEQECAGVPEYWEGSTACVGLWHLASYLCVRAAGLRVTNMNFRSSAWLLLCGQTMAGIMGSVADQGTRLPRGIY